MSDDKKPSDPTPNHWMTYVTSGRYTQTKFVNEAKRIGVSRKIAAHNAKGLEFADIVHCMDWRHGMAECFCDFIVTGISMPAEVQKVVHDKLKAQGKVTDSGSGGVAMVVRECGSYFEGGGCSVADDVKLADIVKMSEEVAKELDMQDMFWLLKGRLSKVHTPPFRPLVAIQPKFMRGILRVKDSSLALFQDANADDIIDGSATVVEHRIIGVENYRKRTTKKRNDLTPRLLPPAPQGA